MSAGRCVGQKAIKLSTLCVSFRFLPLFQGVTKSLGGQRDDARQRHVAGQNTRQTRLQEAGFAASSSGFSETEIETEFEEETMPETRLLDALALHKWSDLQQLYRPSL
ncbi:MAG: hypothetical protein ACPIOQ_43880 [Promethearchaeia archaeon]